MRTVSCRLRGSRSQERASSSSQKLSLNRSFVPLSVPLSRSVPPLRRLFPISPRSKADFGCLLPVGVYFLCLLISDSTSSSKSILRRSLTSLALSSSTLSVGMSLSAIGDLTWSRTYLIEHSNLCVFQGVTNQVRLLCFLISRTSSIDASSLLVSSSGFFHVFRGEKFGVTAGAFWNLTLAIQTFLVLFVRYSPPPWAKWVVVP